jgi:hypothetical protein
MAAGSNRCCGDGFQDPSPPPMPTRLDMGLFGGLLGWEAPDERLAPRARPSGRPGSGRLASRLRRPAPQHLPSDLPTAGRLTIIAFPWGRMIEVVEIDRFGLPHRRSVLRPPSGFPSAGSEFLRARCSRRDLLHRNDRTLIGSPGSPAWTALPAGSQRGGAGQDAGPVLPILAQRTCGSPSATCGQMLAWNRDRPRPGRLAAATNRPRGIPERRGRPHGRSSPAARAPSPRAFRAPTLRDRILESNQGLPNRHAGNSSRAGC